MVSQKQIEEFEEVLSGTSPENPELSEEAAIDVVVVEEDDSAPLKAELERVKSKKSPEEKAINSLYFNAEKAKELGIDVTKDEKLKKILGISDEPKFEEEPISEEDKPLTKKDLEEFFKQKNAQKTAIELASEITDPFEKELVEYHLQNTIKSTGDANEDLNIAKTLANSVRDKKFRELSDIKPESKSHSSASGASLPTKSAEPELTAVEKAFVDTGKISKEEILNLRPRQ